jgi:hypothetical protein
VGDFCMTDSHGPAAPAPLDPNELYTALKGLMDATQLFLWRCGQRNERAPDDLAQAYQDARLAEEYYLAGAVQAERPQ